MGKLQRDENGFSAVEVVLVLVIVALIGVVGWLVYKDHRKTVATNNVATTTSTKATTTPKTTTPTNPYANWSSYCDTMSNGCFYYPSSWKLVNNSQFETSVTDPTNTVSITYNNSDSKDSAANNSQILGQYSMHSSSLDDAVVGLTTPSTGPDGAFLLTQLGVYSDSYLQTKFGTTSLTTGKSYDILADPTIAVNSDQDVTFTANPVNTLTSQQQASTWLSNSATQTGIQILESLYIK
jgi:Tfp pilus assembly protein PilE